MYRITMIAGLILLLLVSSLSTASARQPDVKTCKEFSASDYNAGLRVRRAITGNDQRFRRKPVCIASKSTLRKSIRRARAKCLATASSNTASVYGPGLYGNRTANGTVLTKSTIGVAHKSLPFGTRLHFKYGSQVVRASVIDRGPFVAGRTWDLTAALANVLGFPWGVAAVTTAENNCWAVWR